MDSTQDELPVPHEDELPVPHEKGPRFFSFFAQPWVGITGSIASILSLLLAVFFFSRSISRPELVYYVNPARTTVVKQGTTSRLTVSVDGHPLSQDVTAVQIAVWNRGKQAIRPSSVLEPVIIRTESAVPILEATIRRKSREVVALNLDQAHLAEGQVAISWKILEQDDGGVVQLVYAAGTGTRIECVGVIEGQTHIRELRYSGAIRTPAQQLNKLKGIRSVLVSMFVTIGFMFVLSIRILTRFYQRAAVGLLTVVMFAAVLYLYFLIAVPTVPFGFE